MAFEFSLMDQHFTPIRPQKIEQLFSPSANRGNRVVNDLTYRVPDLPLANLKYDGDETTNIGYPSIPTRFPRQSTGLKSDKQCQSSNSNVQQTVASNLSLQSESLYPSDDIVNQYVPFYQLQDSHPIRAVCFHPLGETFVVGSNSKILRICKYPNEEELRTCPNDDGLPNEPEITFSFLKSHRGSIYCVSFNNTGNLLASGSNDQTVQIVQYNAKKHLPEKCEYKLTMHSGTVRDLCFMHNGFEQDSSHLLSAGAGDNEIYLTDCKTMKPLSVFRGHESTVMSLHCWDHPTTFASGSLDRSIRLWDTRAKKCVSMTGTSHGSGSAENHADKAPVGVVRVENSGKLLASGHKDGRCMLYDIKGGKIVQLFKAHDDEVRTLNFSPKTYYLLTASYDRKVKLWDLQGDLTKKLPNVDVAVLNDKVVQTAWHPNEYNFVTTSADGNAILWTMPGLQNIGDGEQ